MTYGRRRQSSPAGGRIVDPMRASTGNIPAGSAPEPYHSSTSRPHDAYSSPRTGRDIVDISKPTRYWEAAGLKKISSHLDTSSPTASKTYRDVGSNPKSTTEYAIRPRSNTDAAGRRPLSVVVPPSTNRQPPIVEPSYERTRSPRPNSQHYYASEDNAPYIYPATSSRGRYYYRPGDMSDSGRAVPSDKESRAKHKSSGRGATKGYPASGSSTKYRGEDFDNVDSYSYTNPREQFDRDSIAGEQFLHANYGRRERPRSMTGLDGYRPQLELRREPRKPGHPPSRTPDRLRPEDGYRPSRSSWLSPQAPVSHPRAGDDGYTSYQEDYGASRDSRRPRRYEDPDLRGRPQPTASHGDRHYGVDSRRRNTGEDGSGAETAPSYSREPRTRDHDHNITSDRRRAREYDDEYAHDRGDGKSGSRKVDEATRVHDLRKDAARKNHYESDADDYTTDDDHQRFLRPPGRRPRPDSPSDKHRQRDDSRRGHPRESGLDDSEPHRSSRRGRKEDTDGEDIHDSQRESFDDPRKSHTSERPTSRDPDTPPKGILKPPRDKFPEDKNAVREGVAPLKDATKKGIPPGARWTKIDRKMVNPAALEARQERFEERLDYVIVLRVLTREEIQELAEDTQKIRGMPFIPTPGTPGKSNFRNRSTSRS